MKIQFEEALEAVIDLNLEIGQQLGVETPYGVILETNGFDTIIRFEDRIIWNDNDEEREFIEDQNCYEPMLPFLKKQVNKIMVDLSKLKFEL